MLVGTLSYPVILLFILHGQYFEQAFITMNNNKQKLEIGYKRGKSEEESDRVMLGKEIIKEGNRKGVDATTKCKKYGTSDT